MKELEEHRDKISKIDDAILDLLIKRFELTDEVGRIKKKNNISVENKELEEKILARFIERMDGSPSEESILKIYKEIFSESKGRQRNM
jgi:chorismate mutase/prephenate dehydratase